MISIKNTNKIYFIIKLGLYTKLSIQMFNYHSFLTRIVTNSYPQKCSLKKRY